MVGHAAGPSPLRSVNLFVQWLDLLAVGAWIGGLAWLLAGLRGRERPEQLASAVRFSSGRTAARPGGVTGVSRALHLAGGWQGLLDSGYGRFLDLRWHCSWAGGAGAMNRYRVLPPSPRRPRLDDLRRDVRGEVVLAVFILAVTASSASSRRAGSSSSRPPPSRRPRQASRPRAATSPPREDRPDRVAGPAGPDTFTARVTDYGSGEDWPGAPGSSCGSRPRAGPDRPSTLELARAGDGSWRGQGSHLWIAGTWAVVGLVEGRARRSRFPWSWRPTPPPSRSRCPGPPGSRSATPSPWPPGYLQGYIDPGQQVPGTVQLTFFSPAGTSSPPARPAPG